MSKEYVVNDQIESGQTKLITEEGELHGDVSVKEALEMAYAAGLDLVQMSQGGDGQKRICKITDFGKMRYKSTKNKKSRINKVKEIRYGFNISDHDLKVKHKKVFSFIKKKHTVRYILELKGRQSKLVEEGLEVIKNNLKDFDEIASYSDPKISKSYSNSRIVVILNPA